MFTNNRLSGHFGLKSFNYEREKKSFVKLSGIFHRKYLRHHYRNQCVCHIRSKDLDYSNPLPLQSLHYIESQLQRYKYLSLLKLVKFDCKTVIRLTDSEERHVDWSPKTKLIFSQELTVLINSRISSMGGSLLR